MSDAIQIVERWVYPIKGMGGYKIPDGQPMKIDKFGVVGSRRTVLLDTDTNEPVTAKTRGMHDLLKMRPKPGPNQTSFVLADELVELCKTTDAPVTKFKIYGDLVLGRAIAPNVSDTLSRQFNRGLMLVEFVPEFGRIRAPEKAWKGGAPTAFVDGAAVHMVNNKTAQKAAGKWGPDAADVRRFKPDLVCSGPAGLEHTWDQDTVFYIGNAVFERSRPLDRCPLPTRNPDLPSVVNPEISRMLSTDYRMQTPQSEDLRPCFGVGLDVNEAGEIFHGSQITVVEI